jgi:hypothetical protein
MANGENGCSNQATWSGRSTANLLRSLLLSDFGDPSSIVASRRQPSTTLAWRLEVGGRRPSQTTTDSNLQFNRMRENMNSRSDRAGSALAMATRVLMRPRFLHLVLTGALFCSWGGGVSTDAFTLTIPAAGVRRPSLAGAHFLSANSIESSFENEDCPDFEAFLNQVGEFVDGAGDPSTSLQLGRSRDNGQRGIIAKRDIEEGDLLFRLPFEASIVIESQESTEPERAYKFLEWQDNNQVSDVHRPYLDLLPTRRSDFDPTPDFWTHEEIQELELPELVDEVLERKENLEDFASSPQNVKKKSIEDLQFASWLVKTRAFSIFDVNDMANEDENDADVQCVLVPYVDMINHASGDDPSNTQVQVYEDTLTGKCYYELLAVESIPKGKELLLSYGTGEDETIDLLMNYGFVPAVNPYDVEALEGDGFEWSSSVDEDETELKTAEDPTRRTILRLRIKLKRAMEGLEK